MQISSKVLDKANKPRGDKLIVPWLRQLAAGAAGTEVSGYLVARDAVVTMAPLDSAHAYDELANLVRLWRRNLDAPLPLACKTALAQLNEGDARTVYEGGFELSGEVDDPCLARLWPDFAALSASGEWPALAERLYGGLTNWLEQHVKVTKLDGEQA